MTKLQKLAGIALAAILIAAVLNMLPGCVSLEAPKSMNERLAYAFASLAAARNTAASMVERGRITPAQGQEAQTIANHARTLLDGSRTALASGDMQTAEGQLKLALDLLTALETRLKAEAQ